MSSLALTMDADLTESRSVNPWLVAIAVVVPTFMEILDTTVANVALRYMSGGLAAPVSDSEWIITSYLAANAIVLPITGWLSAHLGRRNYFLLSIAVFTLSSAMCGFATSLGAMILFRIIQGLSGGGLQPCSQGVLLDSFPPEKQGTAMTLFGVAAIIAPIVGPTLGGWLCVNYNWRWIFLVNVPIGVFALIACWVLVDDPAYLKHERAKLRGQPLNFDYIGLGVLCLVMSCWEVILSKGQEWDWFGDPFWRLQTLLVLFVVGLGYLIFREMRISNPIINFRVLGERNLAVGCIVLFCAFAVVYGASIALPGMLQTLFGYDALRAGLVMSPSGASSLAAMVLAGALLSRRVDARWLVAFGLVAMAAANYWMARLNLQVSPLQLVGPRMLLTLGLGLLFAPMSVAAYKYTPVHLRAAAVGILSLLRTEGGSVGTSMAKTIEDRRLQLHVSRIGEFLDGFNGHVTTFLDGTRTFLYQHIGDWAGSHLGSVQALEELRQQQAWSLAYFDTFWVFGVAAIVLLPLVLVMKRSVAEPGEHISAE
jgi:MFS transporter, DHA2 family, multidrug resistance protein